MHSPQSDSQRCPQSTPTHVGLDHSILAYTFMFLSLSKSITLPNRYAQHPAIIRPLALTDLSRICPLPGFLSTRMFQHVDGCFYSRPNFTIFERILTAQSSGIALNGNWAGDPTSRLKPQQARASMPEVRGLRPAFRSGKINCTNRKS